MKIKISSIPPRGFSFTEELDPVAFTQRLNEAPDNDIELVGAPVVVATISRAIFGADFKGDVSARVKQPCSRCGSLLEHDVTATIAYALYPRKLDEEQDEDIGLSYFDDDRFDSTEICQETLIMNLSPFWKPDIEKNEFCEQCGKNFDPEEVEEPLEKKQTLGDLFKKVGLN